MAKDTPSKDERPSHERFSGAQHKPSAPTSGTWPNPDPATPAQDQPEQGKKPGKHRKGS